MIVSTQNTTRERYSPAKIEQQWPIRLLKSTILRGCNLYHRSTVLRQRVDLDRLAGLGTSEAGPEFRAKFIDRFLSLKTTTPTGHMTAGFLEHLAGTTGVRFEEALFEAILAVEASMAFVMHKLDALEFAKIVRDGGSPHIMDFVWECYDPGISRAAARVGLVGFIELLPDTLYARRPKSAETFAMRLTALQKRVKRRQWSSTAAALALAAKRRGLPCDIFGGGYLRLGHGVAQQIVYASNAKSKSFPVTQVTRNEHMATRGRNAVASTVPSQNQTAPGNDLGAITGRAVSDIDLITPNIIELRESVNRRTAEINSPFAFGARPSPTCSEPPYGDKDGLLDRLFPFSAPASVPIALIAGERGTVSVARELDAILRVAGKVVGLATQRGSSVCGRPVEIGSLHPRDTATFLLRDPRVETLVSTVSPRRVVEHGLRLEACDVTAIMKPDVDDDINFFQRGIEVVVKATAGMLIIGAGNRLASYARDTLDPRRITLISWRFLKDPSIEQHLAAGGVAVMRAKYGSEEYIEFRRADEIIASVPISSIKLKLSQGSMSSARRVQTRMFAAALALGLGLSGRKIASAMTQPT